MANSTLDNVRKQLRLDRRNGWIAGVCAGFANRFRTDPVIVRVGMVIAALFFPKTVIAGYLLAWLVLDEAR
ncbi:MAG: PspC domain-containing protein [Pseudomonadales bacterium]|nr:PspC domain-containing protein [Pseudomonadales bacterium]NIX07878.1 PspC domain-containing protein [Pseudomonadales bacterium]